MKNTMYIDIKTIYDNLLIESNIDLSTLESNYYINKVCIAYSKIICLCGICEMILNDSNVIFAIEENNIRENIKKSSELLKKRRVYCDITSDLIDLNNYDDIKKFFGLFDKYEMPKIYACIRNNYFKPIFLTNPHPITEYILLHDFDLGALKIKVIKHYSPPQYFVTAIEDILKYLITYKRTEEIQKIEKCIKHQEYLYKNLILVKEIVSISKVLSDESVDGRIKVYVLNSLQMILKEQEKLHEEMGMAPTITHIDFFA